MTEQLRTKIMFRFSHGICYLPIGFEAPSLPLSLDGLLGFVAVAAYIEFNLGTYSILKRFQTSNRQKSMTKIISTPQTMRVWGKYVQLNVLIHYFICMLKRSINPPQKRFNSSQIKHDHSISHQKNLFFWIYLFIWDFFLIWKFYWNLSHIYGLQWDNTGKLIWKFVIS